MVYNVLACPLTYVDIVCRNREISTLRDHIKRSNHEFWRFSSFTRSNYAADTAAIDTPDGRGHERREIRGKEDDDIGDLLGRAEAAER